MPGRGGKELEWGLAHTHPTARALKNCLAREAFKLGIAGKKSMISLSPSSLNFLSERLNSGLYCFCMEHPSPCILSKSCFWFFCPKTCLKTAPKKLFQELPVLEFRALLQTQSPTLPHNLPLTWVQRDSTQRTFHFLPSAERAAPKLTSTFTGHGPDFKFTTTLTWLLSRFTEHFCEV